MVDYDTCKVDHGELNSIYFGKYYYRDEENYKHVVSDCMLTYLSQISHKIEFVKWENFDNDRYALKWQKTYILYPEGSQQYELQPNKPIYITGNETDKIRYEYTPIDIQSRKTDEIKQVLCVKDVWGNSASGNPCEKKNIPQPNPSAYHKIVYNGIQHCDTNGQNCVTGSDHYWEWTDYTKQCNVVYRRPDDSTLNLNNWWDLITSWDETPVNNAVCK